METHYELTESTWKHTTGLFVFYHESYSVCYHTSRCSHHNEHDKARSELNNSIQTGFKSNTPIEKCLQHVAARQW